MYSSSPSGEGDREGIRVQPGNGGRLVYWSSELELSGGEGGGLSGIGVGALEFNRVELLTMVVREKGE